MGYSKTDLFLYKTDLQDYIEFYNLLPKVTQLKSGSPLLLNNKDYQNFLLINSKNPPALCYVGKFIKNIPLDRKYFSYYYNNPLFWMIPIESASGRITGFLLKSFYGKSYNWIHYSKISLLFGFYDFKDYKKGDPIILVEGWRDCVYIKQFYKYSLALNTASLNKGTLELLSCLTDKIIMILDNDTTGNKMSVTNAKMCDNKGINCITLQPMLKDLGEYFIDNSYKDKLMLDLIYAFDFLNHPIQF